MRAILVRIHIHINTGNLQLSILIADKKADEGNSSVKTMIFLPVFSTFLLRVHFITMLERKGKIK